MALVLNRRIGESVVIGDGPNAATVSIGEKTRGGKIQLLIDAPREIPVRKGEVSDDDR